MDAIENKVLSRVKKMLAIAECSGATEAERDTALKMAYNVLAKHNLTMVDLDVHVANQQDPRAMHIEVGHSDIWAKSIYHSVASLFFCKYFSGQKVNAWKMKLHFVGRESNATTAMHMSTFIVESLIKESRKRFGHNKNPEARAFNLGAAHKLSERIREIKQAQAAEAQAEVKGRDLVLVNLYDSEARANALVISELGFNLKPSAKGKQTVRADAYEAGKEFGAGIGLAPQVTATNAKRTLIGN